MIHVVFRMYGTTIYFFSELYVQQVPGSTADLIEKDIE